MPKGENLKTLHSQMSPEKISEIRKRAAQTRRNKGGPWHSPETIVKMKANNKGSTGKHWKLSAETRKRQSDRQRGEKSYLWKGGATLRNWGFRRSNDYKIWARAVKERDGKKCVFCGSTEKLEADHIKPCSIFPELSLAIDNGRTLCHDCHKQTDTYAGRIRNYTNLYQRSLS